jgi:hypothetical protein
MTRRGFLVATAAAAVGGAVLYSGLDSSKKPDSDPDAKGLYHSGDHVHYDDRLSKLVGEGLKKEWKKVAVLPGMLVAAPGAKFFRNANLTSEVDLGLRGASRLAILRPAFPGETFTLGAGVDYKADDRKAIQSGGIDSDTFAFFSATVGDVVYGNYRQNVEHLDLLTRIQGGELAYTSQTHSNLPLQFVKIDKRVTAKDTGLIIPACETGTTSEDHYPLQGNGLSPDGWREVTDYVALAQGILYGDAQSVGWMINQFSESDPVEVPSDYGPLHYGQN